MVLDSDFLTVTEQQQKTIERYVDTIHELLIDQITCAAISPHRQLKKNRTIFARMLGQLLYEAPKLHTGMVSRRLLEQKLKDFSTKPCPEHHHGRQRGGSALISLAERGINTGILPSKQQVRDIVLKFCQVHYTTVEENVTLKKHQRYCSSEAAYRRAKIQLIYAPDLFSKRGKHTPIWKQQMIEKYTDVIQSLNTPQPTQQQFEWPDIIH